MKFKELALLVRRFVVIALQEVHGDDVLLLLQKQGLLRSHVFLSSHPLDNNGEVKGDSGGVAFLADRRLAFKDSDGVLYPLAQLPTSSLHLWSEVLAPGRCLRARFWDPKGVKSIIAFVVHNYALTSGVMLRIENSLRRDITLAQSDAANNSVLLVGDFNIHPVDEPKIRVDSPCRPGIFTSYNAPFASRWERIFDDFTEIVFPHPNHFCSANCTLNKLTRLFVLVSRSVLPLLMHQSGIIRDPIYFDAHKLSDHAPSFWSVSILQRPRNHVQRISPVWCSHPAYKKRMEALCSAAKLDNLPVKERSILIKEFARDAAIHARDVMFESVPNSKVSVLIRLSSISRAVWSGDMRLYNIITSASQLARHHLHLVGGIPALRDPGRFEEDFRCAKLAATKDRDTSIRAEHAGPRSGENSEDFNNARKTARLRVNQEQGKLWLPKASAFQIMGVKVSETEASEMGIDCNEAGVRVEGGWVSSASPEHYFKAFSSVWGKVFGHKDTDLDVAGCLLHTYLKHKHWDWSKLIHPNLQIVEFILSKLKSTAPGLDGITNMAWKHGGGAMARYILDLLDAFCENGELPDDINLGLMAFLDKAGEDPQHAVSPAVIFRHPSETRPLTLKQGDNKHVASTLNYCISPAIAAGAIESQRGFIHSRQLGQNVVDLDFHGRKHALQWYLENQIPSLEMFSIPTVGIVASIPLVVLFDFASAFPSVAHAWLFCVLEAVELWSGFITAIKNLYKGNEAFGMCGGLLMHMFSILSGVLQGCPLSGTLFVLVVDPLLWLFRVHINSAVIRACADDIGAALRRMDDLVILARIFEDFRKASRLTLKPAKCILILTVCDEALENLDKIRQWLSEFVPLWRGMKIQACAKYLGFYLGPKAGSAQWEKPIAKFQKRCRQLNVEDLPLKMAISRFSYSAVPVLGYVAQLVPPPHNIVRTELTGILQALKLAGNSMSADAAFSLKDWFGVNPVRPSVYMDASLLRAAFKTFQGYEAMHKELEELAPLCLSLSQAGVTITPPGWDSDAFCSNLYNASRFEGMKTASNSQAPIKHSLSSALKLWQRARARGQNGGSLQKRFYVVLENSISNGWISLLNNKLGVFLDSEGGPPTPFTNSHLQEFIKSFKSCPTSIQTSVFKTLINSWSTTCRYHEVVLWPCIFGCNDCKDELKHYLSCPPMWALAVSAASLPSAFLSFSPCDRLCLFSNSVCGMRLLAVASRGYHALKFGHREVIERCIANQDFAELNLIFTRVCSDVWRHI